MARGLGRETVRVSPGTVATPAAGMAAIPAEDMAATPAGDMAAATPVEDTEERVARRAHLIPSASMLLPAA